MTALLTGLASLLVFGGVVLVHELGHFMAARHCGIHVEEFSIGFGPCLWSTTRDGTTYSVRLLPLGGYNLFSPLPDEEDNEEDESGESAPPPAPRPRKTTLFPLVVSGQKFEDATAWQRFFVTLCGALMNFILGVAVLLVLVLTMGKVGSTTIADFSENATSSAALQEGDTILQICSNPCWTLYDITDMFYTGEEETCNVVVLRGSEVLELQDVTFTPTRDADGNVLYGTDFRVEPMKKDLRHVIVMTCDMYIYYSRAILGSFFDLLAGKVGVEELSGPLGTVSAVNQAVHYGWREVLSLLALLTINVGIFNLLPIPALDGCKVLYLAWEGLTGHPVPPRVQGGYGGAGVADDSGHDARYFTILIRRTTMQRQLKKEVKIGSIKIGGTNPIAVQTMLNVPVKDIAGNVAQAERVAKAGCQIVRVTVPTPADAAVVAAIKEKVDIPVVADIHFDYRAALAALDAGADKIRINPGNIGDDDRVKAVADACNARNVPIRIGVNGGSLEKHILAKYGAPVPEAMVESAMYHVRLLQKYDFDNIVISIKSSNVPRMMAAYRLLAGQTDYPLHVGVTEAGGNRMGLIKSGMGIGGLLMEGIGDTLRVSLTDEPENEVYAGYDILRAAGYAVAGPEIISCPTCGRTQYPMIEIANEVEARLRDEGFKKPLKIAIMGCVVNGPGEASDADIGIAGGKDEALLFIRGEKIRMLKGDIVGQLLEEIHKM